MFTKEIYVKQIIGNLSVLKNEISLRNAINLYDINIVAEDFYAGLLNLIYDLKLKNVNKIEKNAAAIDLIDSENGISIQVTSNNTSDKIKHTISEYISNGTYEDASKLVILILTDRKNYTKDFDTQGKFLFDKSKDIWDLKTIVEQINKLDIEQLKEINNYLQTEFSEKREKINETQASEVDTIVDLIEYISGHKQVVKTVDVVVDPEYKILNRFKEFSQSITSQYMNLYSVYGSTLGTVKETLEIDEAQDIVTRFYLQDLSVSFLDKTKDNPIQALNNLVDYFEEKLSGNGKKYDRSAIKFYLLDELIQCSVFPNERSEYDGSKC